jgi:hypothetical protein
MKDKTLPFSNKMCEYTISHKISRHTGCGTLTYTVFLILVLGFRQHFLDQKFSGKKKFRENCSNTERLQVVTAANMKKTVFWDIAPCSLVEVYRRFRSALLTKRSD